MEKTTDQKNFEEILHLYIMEKEKVKELKSALQKIASLPNNGPDDLRTESALVVAINTAHDALKLS